MKPCSRLFPVMSTVRDFAYVARDRTSRRYMCHVFRCDLPARTIASTLCEICKRAVAQRAGTSAASGSTGGAIVGRNHAPLRPTDLPNLTRDAGEEGGISGAEAVVKYDALLKSMSIRL